MKAVPFLEYVAVLLGLDTSSRVFRIERRYPPESGPCSLAFEWDWAALKRYWLFPKGARTRLSLRLIHRATVGNCWRVFCHRIHQTEPYTNGRSDARRA